jgi:CMP-2-keto-3-deoxyoctulosonic acid synthetase
MLISSDAHQAVENRAVSVCIKLYETNQKLNEEIVRAQQDTEALKALQERVLRSAAVLLGNPSSEQPSLKGIETVRGQAEEILAAHIGNQSVRDHELKKYADAKKAELEAQAKEIEQLKIAISNVRL